MDRLPRRVVNSNEFNDWPIATGEYSAQSFSHCLRSVPLRDIGPFHFPEKLTPVEFHADGESGEVYFRTGDYWFVFVLVFHLSSFQSSWVPRPRNDDRKCWVVSVPLGAEPRLLLFNTFEIIFDEAVDCHSRLLCYIGVYNQHRVEAR